jgi:hypothetical protein
METKPRRNILTIALVVLTFLVPASALHWTRVYAGPPAVDPFGMPWPEPFWHGLQYVAAGIVALTIVLAIVGIARKGSSRVAGIIALVVVVVFAFFGLALNGVLFGYSNPGY